MNDLNVAAVWVYLSASPLFGLTLTLVAYGVAYRVYHACKMNPILNPVLVAVGLVIAVLLVGRIAYHDYFAGGQYIHFLLGPATVALAIPLYRQLETLKKLWLPIVLAATFGVTLGGISAVVVAKGLGADVHTLLSLVPKSVTAPVAMAIAEQTGGLPSLTAVLVVLTGIIGAMSGSKLFSVLRVKEDSVKGIAMGIAAHGIGTARAFQISAGMGAFSGLAMALSALIASLLIPWLITQFSVFFQ